MKLKPKPHEMSLRQLRSELLALENPAKAHFLKGFFKCGPGDHAEGDVMLGISVPAQRKVAKKFSGLPIADIKRLLASREHEFRFVALVILTAQYRKADVAGKKEVARFYLQNLRYVNNWDLVDTSAPQILGAHLFNHDKRPARKLLLRLARSTNLWHRRIAIVATQYFIRMNDYALTLEIAKMLLADKHDLIHKATGWMLREVGKRDLALLEVFLQKHKSEMPRTMLRYAIEKFPHNQRLAYMARA